MKAIPFVLAAVVLAGCKTPKQQAAESMASLSQTERNRNGRFPEIKVGDAWAAAQGQIAANSQIDGWPVIALKSTERVGDAVQYNYLVNRAYGSAWHWVIVQNDTVIGVGGPS